MTSDTDLLTEYVRQVVSKANHNINMLNDDAYFKSGYSVWKVEKMIADGIQQTEHGNYLSMDPNDSQGILEAIASQVEQLSLMEQSPIILMFSCS